MTGFDGLEAVPDGDGRWRVVETGRPASEAGIAAAARAVCRIPDDVQDPRAGSVLHLAPHPAGRAVPRRRISP